MNELPKISDAEYEVMKVVWAGAPISTNDVIHCLKGRCDWSPKTIQTLLSRLVKKEVLEHQKAGRVYIYVPKVREEDYVKRESRSFLNRFYDGAISTMVLNFIQTGEVSANELAELQSILDGTKRTGGN